MAGSLPIRAGWLVGLLGFIVYAAAQIPDPDPHGLCKTAYDIQLRVAGFPKAQAVAKVAVDLNKYSRKIYDEAYKNYANSEEPSLTLCLTGQVSTLMDALISKAPTLYFGEYVPIYEALRTLRDESEQAAKFFSSRVEDVPVNVDTQYTQYMDSIDQAITTYGRL